MHAGLAAWLAEEQRRGRVGSCGATAAAMLLFAALHWLAVLERVGMHGGRLPEEVVRAMVRALWTGLAPRRRR